MVLCGLCKEVGLRGYPQQSTEGFMQPSSPESSSLSSFNLSCDHQQSMFLAV